MKLQEISGQDTVTQQVVRKMIDAAKIFAYAEFYPMVGNSDYVKKASTASGGKFRAANSNYPGNVASPSYANPTLKIMGDKVEVDRAYERRGLDVASERARHLLNFASNLGKYFQTAFVNGDTDSNSDMFDGIKKLCPGGQKITAAANGQSVPLGNSDANKTAQQKFIELINQLISSIDGGAQLLMMDAKTLSRLSTIARDQVVTVVDDFGKPIQYFNGVPILDAGYDPSGNRVIGHDEIVGSSGAVCTSIYAMRFGEKADLSIATNRGIMVHDLGLVGVHYSHHVEMDVVPVLCNNKAVARLEGIIIS